MDLMGRSLLHRILIVDDDPDFRKLIKLFVEDTDHDCEAVEGADEALDALRRSSFDLVVSDICMSGKDGLQLAREAKKEFPDLDFIIMTGYVEKYTYSDIIESGASDYITKPFSCLEFKAKLERIAREKGNLDRLREANSALKEAHRELQSMLDKIVSALTCTLEMHDPLVAGHQNRVAKLSCSIASRMEFENGALEKVKIAGLIHDIGKVSVPSELLSKPTKLRDIEMDLIRHHPTAGYEILRNVDMPWPIAEVVLQHHERINGAGYPKGLRRGHILLESQIIAVADVYEAMTSHRPYRPSRGEEAAIEELWRNRGLLYNEDAVDVCLDLLSQGFDFDNGNGG